MNKFPPYKGKIKLDLGCGHQQFDGFIGIDINDNGQQMIWDIRKGIPFPDNSVDEIFSSHFVEHLTDEESIELFREIYRVLKPKGKTHHRCPHQENFTAHYWGHRSYWNEGKIDVITRVPGCENFLVLENKKVDSELFFALSKIK